MAKYDDFVQALVERYGAAGVKEWAIENEINSPDNGPARPQQYADLVKHAAGVIRKAQPGAIVLDSGVSSPTMGTRHRDEPAAGRARSRRRSTPTSATTPAATPPGRRTTPTATSVADLQRLAATEKWQHNEDVIDTTLKLANDGVIDRLQLHFYERWDAVPLLMSFVRSNIPADVPVEAWEVGLFDVDDTMSRGPALRRGDQDRVAAAGLRRGAGPVAAPRGRPERRAATRRSASGCWSRTARHGWPRRSTRSCPGSAPARRSPAWTRAGLLGFIARRGDQATVVAWAQDGVGAGRLGGGSRPLDGAPTTTGSATTIGSSPVVVDVPMAKADQLAAPG